jgi:3' terminal RNA ribose 2'-O-methyltransferase Hen1
MILTLSTTHQPATDLGYLLHKNPDRHHTSDLPFGTAHVLYPEATEDRCSMSFLVDIDPVGLVRNSRGPRGNNFSLSQYVNDRPFATSSFMSVALAKVFSTAMGGRSKERPELADQEIPLEVILPVVPVRGGEELLRRLFEPLGYEVHATALPLDTSFPAWGDSRHLSVRLKGTKKVRDLLEHLYVVKRWIPQTSINGRGDSLGTRTSSIRGAQ